MKFKQKGLIWSSREYIIEREGLKVISRSLLGTSKKFFDFHHIGKEIIRERERGIFSLLISLLFTGYGIGLLIEGIYISRAVACFFLAIIIILTFYLIGQKYLYLVSGRYPVIIKFLDDNPSEEELIAFISHIKKAQRIRLQQLYLNIDENISYEEHRKNIQWLWDNRFLSRKEAEQRLESRDPSLI